MFRNMIWWGFKLINYTLFTLHDKINRVMETTLAQWRIDNLHVAVNLKFIFYIF